MIDRTIVPCNGCVACCKRDLLILHPELGDDPNQYETVSTTHPLTGKSVAALKHKPEGGCIYLGENGCTIWERAPAICREFDCRRFYRSLLRDTTRAQRRGKFHKLVGSEVLRAGRKRLHTLTEIDG